MFKLHEMLKQSDGFHIVTIHSTDVVFRDAMLEAMKAKGWETHSFSQLDDTTFQWAFVTAEKKKELQERHLHSCRNSLGSAEEVLGKKPGLIDGIIGKLRRGRLGNRQQQEADDFFAIHHSTEVEPDHYTVVVGKERTPQPGDRKYVELNIETNRSFSELRAEDLERQQRERFEEVDRHPVRPAFHEAPRESVTRTLPREEHRDYSRPSRLSDDDDYSRRSSPAPISDPSPSSYDGGGSDGGSSD
jgi:hypothetical protein